MHGIVSKVNNNVLLVQDVTKTQNGMLNRMMHGMGKFHGKAVY